MIDNEIKLKGAPMKKILFVLSVFLLSGTAAFAQYPVDSSSSLSDGTSVTDENIVRGEVVSVDKIKREVSLQDPQTGATREYTASNAEALGATREGDNVIISLGVDGAIQSIRAQ